MVDESGNLGVSEKYFVLGMFNKWFGFVGILYYYRNKISKKI